jgi:protein TonB
MIKKEVDLNSDAWCDLVFEGRNQEYGAYYLRKTSSKRHWLALLIVLTTVVVTILLLPEISRFVPARQSTEEYDLRPIELSDLIALEESSPPVKAEEQPLLKEIVKFTPPTIVKDANMEEIQKDLQEINLAGDSTDTFSALEEDTFRLNHETQQNRLEESDTVQVDEKNKKAEFPDGRTALLRYIYQNIHYPTVAIKQRIHGRVICSFIINEDGSISDITLVQGVYSFLDDEVLRVISSMPSWNPTIKDGKAVKTKCIVPVVFQP